MDVNNGSLIASIDQERVKYAKKWVGYYLNKPIVRDSRSKYKVVRDMIREKYIGSCSKIICDDDKICVFYFDREASSRLGYLFVLNSITIDDGNEHIKMDVILPRLQDGEMTMDKCAILSDGRCIVCGQNEHEVFMRILYLMNLSSLSREDIEDRIIEYNRKQIRDDTELTSILSIQRERDSIGNDASIRSRRLTTVSVFARQRMMRAVESSENIDIVLRFMNKYSDDK